MSTNLTTDNSSDFKVGSVLQEYASIPKIPMSTRDRCGPIMGRHRMQLVEQHIITKSDPRFQSIDEMALASKNLWNLANYYVRQSFIFGRIYLNNKAVYHLVKTSDAYKALPRKVSNQVLIQLDSLGTPSLKRRKRSGSIQSSSPASQGSPSTNTKLRGVICSFLNWSDLEDPFSSSRNSRLTAWVAGRNQAEPQAHQAGQNCTEGGSLCCRGGLSGRSETSTGRQGPLCRA